MVLSCAALNCTNRSKKGSGISFHKFPFKDAMLMKKWLLAIKRKNFKPTRHHSICSEHFTSDSFLKGYVHRVFLKADAVPTIFTFPDELTIHKVKKRSTTTPFIEHLGIHREQQFNCIENSDQAQASTERFEEHCYALNSSPTKMKKYMISILKQNEQYLLT